MAGEQIMEHVMHGPRAYATFFLYSPFFLVLACFTGGGCKAFSLFGGGCDAFSLCGGGCDALCLGGGSGIPLQSPRDSDEGTAHIENKRRDLTSNQRKGQKLETHPLKPYT